VFAKILRGELPSVRLYEDEETLAIMDLFPQTDGHALIMPKAAAATLLEATPASVMACIRTTQRIAQAVHAALAPDGIQIVQYNGVAAGQTVPHLHFHVIPRTSGTTARKHAATQAPAAQLEALAARIRSAIV
jgi:histidine triad (HIT) family protein